MIHPVNSSNQQYFTQLNAAVSTRKNSFGTLEDITISNKQEEEQQQNYSLFQYTPDHDIELLFPSHLGNQLDSEVLSYHSASYSSQSSSSGLPYNSISNEQILSDSNTHSYFFDLHQQESLPDNLHHSEQQPQLQNNHYQEHLTQYEQTQPNCPQINYYNCAAEMNNYNYLNHPLSYYSSQETDSRTFEVKQEQNQNETFSSFNYSEEEETPLERVLSCPQTLQISRNYYQILLDYERHQKEQQSLNNVITKPEQKITQKPQHKHIPDNDSNDLLNLELEIKKSNKKNVVKNIMSAFKNFIFEGTENQLEQQKLLALYNSTKKGLNDDLQEMQAKFKRYISSKNFNHYTVKLLIQHTNYSPVFKYFLEGPVLEWVTQSKVADVSSHLVMIDYLKDCFKEINKIEILKRHEKKRAHYQ